jgi:hypothetical protein
MTNYYYSYALCERCMEVMKTSAFLMLYLAF